MAIIPQSTSYTTMFLMVLTSDHISPATGKTVTVNLSKAGGTFGAAGGTVTEVANGWYKVALNTTDTNTVGDLALNCTASGCDNTDFREQVGPVGANVVQWLGTAPNALNAGRVDAATSLRSGTAQAAGASTLTLDAGASAGNGFYNDCQIFTTGGTGAGQMRTILSYVGSTKVATVSRAWTPGLQPDSTTTFTIVPVSDVDTGIWQGNAVGAGVSGIPQVDVIYVHAATINSLISGRVDASVGAIAAGQYTIKKNTALTFTFAMMDSTNHQLVTGKTVTVKYSIDGGAQATTSGSVVEISGGLYKIALLAAETNGTQISLTMTATGSDDQAFTFFTQA